MRHLVLRSLLSALLLAACVPTEQLTPTPVTRRATRTTPHVPQPTLDLHLQITNGVHPVEGTIWLYWPDTGGDFGIGPTSDIVLPIPADGTAVSVTVTAPGYLAWSQVLTPTRSASSLLVVRLIEE